MARNPLDIYKFIQAATSLAKKGVKESEILEFAKREFGEVSDLLKIQVRRLFKNKDAPSIKNPSKDADIVPFNKNQASGITQTEEASPLMKGIEDTVSMLQKNPRRAGGPLDPKTGIVRTATRQILQKLAREGKINIADENEAKAIMEGYQGGVDPIAVFKKTFGQDVLNDVSTLGDELLEIDRQGGSYKELDKILEQEGFFNLRQTDNPPQGMTDDQLEKMLKETKDENILKDFDPTDRNENSMGGINRVNLRSGTKVIKLAKFFKDKGTTLVAEIRKAVDNIFASGDSKYDADVAVDSALEEFGVDREMFDQMDIIDAYDKAYQTIVTQRGLASGKIPKDDVDLSQGMIDLDEMNFTKNAKAAKEAIDSTSDADLLVEKKILEEVDQAYGVTPEMKRELDQMGGSKLTERFELKKKYPGITEDLLTNIIESEPQKKAEVLATIDEAFRMMEKGKGPDEVVEIFKNTTRTKQANGGLSYLMGM